MDDGCEHNSREDNDAWPAVMADLQRDLASEGWNIDALRTKWEAWDGSKTAIDKPKAFKAWALKWTAERKPGDELASSEPKTSAKIRIGKNDPRWRSCLTAIEPLIQRPEDRRAIKARGYIDASPEWLATILNQAA